MNRILGVMVGVLFLRAVDHEFEPRYIYYTCLILDEPHPWCNGWRALLEGGRS